MRSTTIAQDVQYHTLEIVDIATMMPLMQNLATFVDSNENTSDVDFVNITKENAKNMLSVLNKLGFVLPSGLPYLNRTVEHVEEKEDDEEEVHKVDIQDEPKIQKNVYVTEEKYKKLYHDEVECGRYKIRMLPNWEHQNDLINNVVQALYYTTAPETALLWDKDCGVNIQAYAGCILYKDHKNNKNNWVTLKGYNNLNNAISTLTSLKNGCPDCGKFYIYDSEAFIRPDSAEDTVILLEKTSKISIKEAVDLMLQINNSLKRKKNAEDAWDWITQFGRNNNNYYIPMATCKKESEFDLSGLNIKSSYIINAIKSIPLDKFYNNYSAFTEKTF